MGRKSVLLTLSTLFLGAALASPARMTKNAGNETDVGNLKLTFDNPEDVPSAFFDAPDSPAPSSAEPKEGRRIYSSCQDGSGGMCLSAGECPANLKANSAPGACKPNQECCYGFPASETSCRSRGGECTAPGSCGQAPTLSSTECNPGQVCCIFVK